MQILKNLLWRGRRGLQVREAREGVMASSAGNAVGRHGPKEGDTVIVGEIYDLSNVSACCVACKRLTPARNASGRFARWCGTARGNLCQLEKRGVAHAGATIESRVVLFTLVRQFGTASGPALVCPGFHRHLPVAPAVKTGLSRYSCNHRGRRSGSSIEAPPR